MSRQAKRLRRVEKPEEDYVDEEMKRPPYLHVRGLFFFTGRALADAVHSLCLLVASVERVEIC